MVTLSIRSSAIRLGMFISTLVIAAIIVFQLVWLKKVYRKEQKEFDQSVIKTIRGLYEDINASNYNYSHLNELIEKPEAHLYLARLILPVNHDSLVSYLQYELEDFGIFTDCHIGIYNSASGKYIYTGVLKSAGTKAAKKQSSAIPLLNREYDHLTLFFPNRQQYILAQMNFWIISSALLLLVLILFSASLYYFYRQKFLNETQKDFIHNFTHEFKTPVSVISLAAEVLKDPAIAGKPEKLATYAGIVEYQAAYLKSQTEKLLNFAYIESGHLHFSKQRVNIHELIETAVTNLAPLINERKANLTLELNTSNPFLNANKDYLIIVIMNLLDNAIKYSKDPKIIVTVQNRGDHILVSVKDNGIGIEKRQIKNLFRKFFRIRKEEAYASKGFGIGLSFVKKIVTEHGGRIKVESEPGKGSTFIVELPAG
ncbi:MAG: HAMP domain-containing histidine kinase [Chitinophagaceae bacterium]|nr:HAMP domain-containing histidine kinase [Chitinophagaceae bacterium]